MRSVLDLSMAAIKAARAQEDFNKSNGTAYGSAPMRVPKSWFADPYAMLDQMGVGFKQNPNSLSYETLMAMAEKNVVVASIIQTRVNQVAAFTRPQPNKYSVGFKIKHRDDDHKLSKSEKEYVKKLERFILNTGHEFDRGRDDFETYIRKITRDRLIFDQICTEKVPRINGKPYEFFALPAETIRLAPHKKKRGRPLAGVETEHIPEYVQVINGRKVNEYTRREMAFGIANPRTSLKANGYGYSELEMLISTVTRHLWAEQWNEKAFSNGATLKGFVSLKGNVPQTQLETFKRQWMAQVAGASNAWRTPIFAADQGVEWVPLQPSNNEMGYQGWLEYLIKVACGIYLIDPAEINFDLRGGPGQAPMFMSTNEAQQKVSKDRGLQPLLRFIASYITKHILWEIDPDYEFVFVGLDAKTEEQAIELRLKEAGSYKTLNEVRAELDLPPVPQGDVVMNAVYTGWLTQQQAQQQQAAQGGALGGAPGAGAPDTQNPGGVEPDQGDDGQQPEAFDQLFGHDGQKPQFGGEEANAAKNIKGSTEEPELPEAEKSADNSTGEEWETSIHASMRRRRSPLTKDIQKALRALNGLR